MYVGLETLAQVFSCEFCEISKNNFFIEHLWWLPLILISSGKLLIKISHLSKLETLFLLYVKYTSFCTERVEIYLKYTLILCILDRITCFVNKFFPKICWFLPTIFTKSGLKGFFMQKLNFLWQLNLLNANPTKWSNTLKQFVGKLPTNCLSMYDHYVSLTLKGLKDRSIFENIIFK